ncbi:MAG: DUF1080 domain-containing protein [Candidatus Omnitrophica bacterium]|nr:DUF1080 domain-containing protein [Candidatus Omnitrophota bacterium]
MRKFFGFVLSILFVLTPLTARAEEGVLSRIAFGSCARQGQPQPIWDSIAASDPDVFLFIGDNIYGDSEDMEVLKEKWNMLASEPGYQKLKETCPILATWDDHDYGVNDGGADYPMKKESQKVFLDFFGEPQDSPRRKSEGVYDAKVFGPEGKRVQVILLDTRYFRSPLKTEENPFEEGEGVGGSYVPDYDPASTMLGEAQWAWLEEQLKVPADLRIIASSVQVIANRHRFEKWGNFPLERQRLFDLIKKTKANGVVIVSGDRHTAEIDRIEGEVGYPLYDVTSSSLNQGHPWRSEVNEHRVGGMYFDDNFGMIDIDWSQEDPLIRLQVLDGSGKVAIQQRVRLNDLWPYSEDHLPPGFVSLFNGKDLSGWVGDTKGYQARDGILLCKPGGNLFTEKEYSDFVLRFDFKFTPGANNGLAIRSPLEGTPAYAGMELQILEDTSDKYLHLKPWQYHGSVYGIAPAIHGFKNPVGEWNSEEVVVKGRDIQVTVNGFTIVDINLDEELKNGPMDGSEHPGAARESGHIGFAGHGDVLEFRNIYLQPLK